MSRLVIVEELAGSGDASACLSFVTASR